MTIALASTAIYADPVGVAPTEYSTDRAEGSVETTTLVKYLVMDADANVPDVEFTYSVEPGDPVTVDGNSGLLSVIPGVGTPVFKLGDTVLNEQEDDPEDDTKKINTNTSVLTFDSNDVTIPEASKTEGDTPVFKTADDADDSDDNDEKYIKKSMTIDFSKVEFTEPGVYRYIIIETGENMGVINGYKGVGETPVNVKTLDVYVEDATALTDTEPTLKITGYVMYDGKQGDAPVALTDTENDPAQYVAGVAGGNKDNTITNQYSTGNITFAKVVTGNQGSKDKFFKYSLKLSGFTTKGAVMAVDLEHAVAAVPAAASLNSATKAGYAEEVNVTSIVVDENATEYKVEKLGDTYTVTVDFYLQHGQYITVKGVPAGVIYNLKEDAEDYVSTMGITKVNSMINWDDADEDADALMDGVPDLSGSGATQDASFISGVIAGEDVYTGYTNDRTGLIPTGLLASFAGPAAIIVLGLGGMAAGTVYLKKKKSEEDD